MNCLNLCVFFFVVPGAITNHKIFKKDGIVVEWDAPSNPNGQLQYYLIEWTIYNKTYSNKIVYKNGRNVFKVMIPRIFVIFLKKKKNVTHGLISLIF